MLGLLKAKKKASRVKILLIDDDPDIVEIIRRRLTPYGWEIITCANGKEGLERAAAEKPDLILLEIDLPVLDGHKTLSCLRRDRDLRDMLVIMCTKSDRIEDMTMANSYNVAGYVNKPFNHMKLVDKIEEALESRNAG